MARKPNISPTPCWDHATHVAGIVDAANNGQWVVGMLPGVEIRSLDVSESEGSVSCSTGLTTSNILSALDRVREDSFVDPKVSVVNMSLNSFGFPNAYYRNGILGFVVRLSASSMTVWVNLPSMPSLYSPGALIVQSAANNDVNACEQAYDGVDFNEGVFGILVVGRLDENGNVARPIVTDTAGFETLVTSALSLE